MGHRKPLPAARAGVAVLGTTNLTSRPQGADLDEFEPTLTVQRHC